LALAATTQAADLTWQQQFAKAREALLAQRCALAAEELATLTQSATNDADRVRAEELASFARAQCARRGVTAQPALRTTDELTLLYTMAVIYGLGTSTWLALQVRPNSFGTALLPFAIITPATVAAVAIADDYRPLRHGIPQAIAAGLYLGFGEGVWVAGYQHAYATHHGTERWSAERVSTGLWLASSVGAVAGGVVGAWRRPTPGRVSFTASTSIWGGLITALAANALAPNADDRRQAAYLVGSMGYNAGLVTGLLFGPSIAPSVTRVRIADLSGLFGGLAAAGGYALLARRREMHVAFGAGAIGSAVALGVAWWATSGMPADRSHDELSPAPGERESAGLASLQPMLAPVRGGLLAGVMGRLSP
jgi:hypothetical protein